MLTTDANLFTDYVGFILCAISMGAFTQHQQKFILCSTSVSALYVELTRAHFTCYQHDCIMCGTNMNASYMAQASAKDIPVCMNNHDFI